MRLAWHVLLSPALGAAAPHPPPARLELSPNVVCLSAEALHEGVAARLGYDPFFEPAQRVVWVQARRTGAGLRAELRLETPGHGSLGDQVLTSPAGDCRELSEALVVALAVALDPLAGLGAPPPVAPAPPAPAIPHAPPHTPPHASPPTFAVAGGLNGNIGSAPGPGAGFSLGASVRWPAVSLGLEGRADLPAGMSVAGGSLQSYLLAALALPCLRYRGFGACAELALGSQQAGAVDLPNAQHWSSLFAGAGGRLLWEHRLTDHLGVGAHADLLAPFVHTALTTGEGSGAVQWETPAVQASAGLQVFFELGGE